VERELEIRDEGGGMRDESGKALKRLNAFLFIPHPSALIPSKG
jgi:hypothetical protein